MNLNYHRRALVIRQDFLIDYIESQSDKLITFIQSINSRVFQEDFLDINIQSI